MITVKQLIEHLQKLDQNAIVSLKGYEGGYTDETNHTFVGYFPANEPQFVLLVKYEAPQRAWADSTAAPTFKKIADFAVKYYGIKGDK